MRASWRCACLLTAMRDFSRTWSAQAALLKACKLLSASCCAQTARHLSSNCSAHVALREFLSARCSAPESERKMLSLSAEPAAQSHSRKVACAEPSLPSCTKPSCTDQIKLHEPALQKLWLSMVDHALSVFLFPETITKGSSARGRWAKLHRANLHRANLRSAEPSCAEQSCKVAAGVTFTAFTGRSLHAFCAPFPDSTSHCRVCFHLNPFPCYY